MEEEEGGEERNRGKGVITKSSPVCLYPFLDWACHETAFENFLLLGPRNKFICSRESPDKGALNLQVGIKNTRPRVIEAWPGSLFGHSFPSYSTAWLPK